MKARISKFFIFLFGRAQAGANRKTASAPQGKLRSFALSGSYAYLRRGYCLSDPHRTWARPPKNKNSTFLPQKNF